MTTQTRNNEMVNLLRADFQARYEPNFAWLSACSAYLNLPGLRAFLPLTSVNESGNVLDLSGQGRTFTNNNTITFNRYNLATYATLNGSTQYFSRADEAGLDFLGTDAFNTSGLKGFSINLWIRITAYNNFQGLVVKGGTPSNYGIFTNAGSTTIRASVYSGVSSYDLDFSGTVSTGVWHFLSARYLASQRLAITIDGITTQNIVGIPASLNNSTNPCEIGRSAGLNSYNGDVALIGFYASYHSDAQIFSLYQQTRALFGV